jgi:hypothetical protein
MKCLQIYADNDGESHFADLDIPLNPVQLFADQPPLRISAKYRASHVQFVTVPPEMRESGWHCPRERVLALWLTGDQEFETSGRGGSATRPRQRRLGRGHEWKRAQHPSSRGSATAHSHPISRRTVAGIACLSMVVRMPATPLGSARVCQDPEDKLPAGVRRCPANQ